VTPTYSQAFVRAVLPEQLGRVVYAATLEWAQEHRKALGPARPWDELPDDLRDRHERAGVAVLRFVVELLIQMGEDERNEEPTEDPPVRLHDPEKDDGDHSGGGPVGMMTVWGPMDAA